MIRKAQITYIHRLEGTTDIRLVHSEGTVDVTMIATKELADMQEEFFSLGKLFFEMTRDGKAEMVRIYSAIDGDTTETTIACGVWVQSQARFVLDLTTPQEQERMRKK